MALATRCPHCNTTFRVAADQLKLRGGVVRCGSCNEVFDGNAALVEPQAPVLSVVPEVVRDAMPDAAPDVVPEVVPDIDVQQASQEPATNAPQEDPLTSFPRSLGGPAESMLSEISMDSRLRGNDGFSADDASTVSAMQADVPVLSDAEPEPVAVAEPAPVIDQVEPVTPPAPVDVAPVAPATPPLNLDNGPLPLLRQASITPYDVPSPSVPMIPARPAKGGKASALSKLKSARPAITAARTTKPLPPPALPAEPDEPTFVTQSRALERTSRTRNLAMIAGAVALTLALLIQGITTFRNVLVARFPGMSPAIASACAALGCRVELPAQIDALSIETGELQTLAPNTFSLITQLRNQSELSQAWPHIELELTDATDKALVRRVFTPAEYLPPGTPATRGFGARSEQSIKLYFELKQLKASGYHIAVFYP